MEIIKRNIILTFDELRILLYSQGYRRCEGVYMPCKDFAPEDIIEALRKLEQNGLLTVDKAAPAAQALPLVFGDEPDNPKDDADSPDEEFYIRSDLLKMIHIMGDPGATEILRTDHEHRVFCYYSEQGIVVSERYHGRKECVRLTYYDAEEFAGWRAELEEEGQ